MSIETALIGISALVISALLTGVVRSLALVHGVLDVPNERSSHNAAVPRGGGVSMVLAATAACLVLALFGALPANLVVAWVVGGGAVAVIGFLDDCYEVPAGIRLAVHFSAAIWAVLWLGGPPALRVGEHVVQVGPVGGVLAIVGIVWILNLFNFMDGIDGIAASEALFITCCGASLTLVGGNATGIAALGWVIGAVCAGFLVWNWPPAKIFMGDVGSGYLGYVIGVLTLADAREDAGALWTWLILGGVFFVDATVTLVRRALRGEKVHLPHRSHAYQWLARRWGSHRRVTLAVLFVNALWLLPSAVLSALYPSRALWVVAGALVPLVVTALAAGSGRPVGGAPRSRSADLESHPSISIGNIPGRSG
jgi:Fuc2NAc and GlcNAc transferase